MLFNSIRKSSRVSHRTSPFHTTLSRFCSKHNSFTVQYLINHCGFSPENAISSAKHLKFTTPERADSVVAFFKNRGFNQSQIAKMIRNHPQILKCVPEKAILPKIEFFETIGLSGDNLDKLLLRGAIVTCFNIENSIMPSVDLLREWLQSDKQVVDAILRLPMVLSHHCRVRMNQNIQILRGLRVPDSSISYLLRHQPRDLSTATDKFRMVAEQVKEMGFDPLKVSFVIGVNALLGMSKATWENKVDLYMKQGWSVEEVFAAFVKHPWCMKLSEDSIVRKMDFFVNKIGWKPSFVADMPVLLCLSLEKRIAPRCMFYQDLLDEGLIEKIGSFHLRSLIMLSEPAFLSLIKKKFDLEAPEAFRLYKKKMDLAKLNDKRT